ncbi:hypothetical protein SDC9_181994 [bioreactor metagenome]|uniref:Uncharacterized protein n=1 Tax=bioreactor metagenome TaxID=1076179 RepID=A0A645H723_9ZZZZ
MEAIHVLGGRDGLDDLVVVNVLGQRQLHQDAVDARVVVQRFHAGQQFGLGHRRFVLFQHGMKARFLAGLYLVAHVDLRRLVVTHQNHRQTRRDSLGFERSGACSDFGAELSGEGLAIDDLGCHGAKTESAGGEMKKLPRFF